MTTYAIHRELEDGYGDVLERIVPALAEEGFGILTRIDVKKTLAEKIGAEFRPYTILGACNPKLAHRALGTDLDVGVLLPCNVVVFENDAGGTTVSAMDPVATLAALAPAPELVAVATEARERVVRALEAL